MSVETICKSPPREAPYLRAVANAFHAKPDAAGIYQGVRHMRQGVVHARTVLVPSPKNGGIIACEGRLEEALVRSLELDPTVAAYRGQPIRIPGPKGRDVVCDFAVRQTDGIYQVLDVKPSGRLQSPDVVERMRHVRIELAGSFVPHRVITEVTLEDEPNRQIRLQLWKGLGITLNEFQRDQLLSFVRRGPVPVDEARKFCRSARIPALAIERLAAKQLLSFEVTAPWSALTLIGERHANHPSTRAGWGSVQDVVIGL